jgi:hypothetical protein
MAFGLALTMGLVAFAGTDTAQAGSRCAQPHEERALNARILQTELMVAALQCRNSAAYNDFVVKFRDHLVSQGDSLRGMFVRQYGASANSHLNALVTRLANQASQRSMASSYGFCQQANLLFAEAQAADAVELERIAAKTAAAAVGHGVQTCGDSAPIVGYGTASSQPTTTDR